MKGKKASALSARPIMSDLKLLQQIGSLTVEQALQQAISYHHKGHLQDAERLYRAILQTQSMHPDANHNLGVLAVQLKQVTTGLHHLKVALEANPNQDQYWVSYIGALIKSGQADVAQSVLEQGRQRGLQGDAIDTLDRLLRDDVPVTAKTSSEPLVLKDSQPTVSKATQSSKRKPNDKSKELGKRVKRTAQRFGKAPSLNDIETLTALFNQKQYQDAETLAQEITKCFPMSAFGWKVLGAARVMMGQYSNGLAPMQRATELSPNDSEAYHNLGNLFIELSRFAEAEVSCRCALEINPTYFEVHSDLGSILLAFRRPAEAELSCRHALAIEPSYAEAHCNLGNSLKDQGLLEKAVGSYRHALAIKPNFVVANTNLLSCLTQGVMVDAAALFSEHCKFGERFETAFRDNCPQHTNLRIPDRTLRIGFVSGDLRDHAVAYFFEPVLSHLSNYPKLELHAYYNNVLEDDTTRRMRRKFRLWRSIAGLCDEDLDKTIRADSVDILVDLSGHTAGNRLLTFARKPAPIQASWIGYLGTTGMKAMDYYLADRFFLPFEQFGGQFAEKIVHLPVVAPFMPPESAPSINALPASSNGYVTFGSFNRLSKLSPQVIALWSQLLRASPHSRMLIGGMPKDGNSRLIDWFEQNGIARNRLIIHPRCNTDAYLALHHQVDFCLDTFPYSGGTTTNLALWMGVPTLTMPGRVPASRVGAAYLSHVGLEGFIALDSEDFVNKGLKWARNIDALAQLRSELRARFEQSAMGQPALAAESVQRVLRLIWQRWCDGLPPINIDVSATPNF